MCVTTGRKGVVRRRRQMRTRTRIWVSMKLCWRRMKKMRIQMKTHWMKKSDAESG
jgi:hypothetical protein